MPFKRLKKQASVVREILGDYDLDFISPTQHSQENVKKKVEELILSLAQSLVR